MNSSVALPSAKAGRPHWETPAWLTAAERWLHASLEALGRPVTGPAQQVCVWDLSCVLQAPTAAGDVYFKASVSSPLFVNEGVVLRTLAELFGVQVPTLLAVDVQRGWMLLADFGNVLEREGPIELREDVLRAFAGMQIAAIPHTGRLLQAGCLDRRLDVLAEQAAALLPALEATGRLPAIDTATWLSSDESARLSGALPRLVGLCAELARCGVPSSLVHGDLHMGNVAPGPRGYVFFDWTDACIAHPFVDLAVTLYDEQGTQRERLRDAYLDQWATFASAERLSRAWALAEPIGALHHAVSYRSLVAGLQPPIDQHMAESTAFWLRQVLAGLQQIDEP